MTDVKHNDITRSRLLKSDEFFQAARRLTQTTDWGSTISFLYYASFHAVTGLLKQSEVNVKSHFGAKKMFDAQYVKSGLVDDKYGKFYARLYRERDESDHQNFAVFTADDVFPLFT